MLALFKIKLLSFECNTEKACIIRANLATQLPLGEFCLYLPNSIEINVYCYFTGHCIV